MIEGDSLEYEVFEETISNLSNPIGATIEIGVRRGMGSKMIIDSFRKHHPNVKLNHLGIDPYGNIEYNPDEAHKNVRLDYTNDMKRDALLDFTKEYPEFNLVCLEDTEFFDRYADGYPIYDQYKIMLSKYDVVHFDGPHDVASILNEVNFFHQRRAKECIFVFDDVQSYPHDKVDVYLKHILQGYKLIHSGNRKAVYLNKSN
tara:strand:+ start:142 stop:747 length:606 start_codon:yes stop_codon:yes gene_type:complete